MLPQLDQQNRQAVSFSIAYLGSSEADVQTWRRATISRACTGDAALAEAAPASDHMDRMPPPGQWQRLK